MPKRVIVALLMNGHIEKQNTVLGSKQKSLIWHLAGVTKPLANRLGFANVDSVAPLIFGGMKFSQGTTVGGTPE
ncbi:MAG: hypothetical protein J0L94_09330 [Rhodothermia bacterium]|nr:hypothetical protein [Rhodothermia bacterium]